MIGPYSVLSLKKPAAAWLFEDDDDDEDSEVEVEAEAEDEEALVLTTSLEHTKGPLAAIERGNRRASCIEQTKVYSFFSLLPLKQFFSTENHISSFFLILLLLLGLFGVNRGRGGKTTTTTTTH